MWFKSYQALLYSKNVGVSQQRLGGSPGGEERRGRSFRARARPHLHGDLCEDGRQCWGGMTSAVMLRSVAYIRQRPPVTSRQPLRDRKCRKKLVSPLSARFRHRRGWRRHTALNFKCIRRKGGARALLVRQDVTPICRPRTTHAAILQLNHCANCIMASFKFALRNEAWRHPVSLGVTLPVSGFPTDCWSNLPTDWSNLRRFSPRNARVSRCSGVGVVRFTHCRQQRKYLDAVIQDVWQVVLLVVFPTLSRCRRWPRSRCCSIYRLQLIKNADFYSKDIFLE